MVHARVRESPLEDAQGLITVHGPGAPGAPKTLTLRVLGAPGAPFAP